MARQSKKIQTQKLQGLTVWFDIRLTKDGKRIVNGPYMKKPGIQISTHYTQVLEEYFLIKK